MKTKLLFATLAFAALNCYAQPGSLDLTFGTGGKVTTDFSSSADAGNSVAIQTDGKIVVAGSGGNADFALARYNSSGTLDLTFDSDGKVTTSFGNPVDFGYAVAIQSDGKIIVAGEAQGSFAFTTLLGLARYQSNGALDNTFGSSGIVTTSIGTQYDRANSVAIQSDGKIVVAGESSNAAFGFTFSVVRYFSNGNPDNTFGTGGITTTTFVGNDFARSLAIQSDGKIVVAGYGNNGSNNDFALARYLSNGNLDTTFGSGGKVTTDFSGDDDKGCSIAIQSDGKIIVAGRSWTGLNVDYALARYDTNGSLDNTFGTGGKLTTPIGSADDIATSVKIQSDGKIVVAGISQGLADNEFSLVRYNNDGTLDITFDSDGKVTTPFGSANDNGNSVAIQSDGKIVVAGYSNNGTNDDFAVARYNGLSTGISERANETDLTAYPNPFSSETVLRTDKPFHNAMLIVDNCFGQPVMQIKNISGQAITFRRGDLPAGLYFISITENDKVIAKGKLVITD